MVRATQRPSPPRVFRQMNMPAADASFASELESWGPHQAGPIPSLHEAQNYCRALARRHYENFPLASWLLPRRLHQHFFNVYAYCRWADDLGDEIGDRQRSAELLAWWRRELDECYAGSVRHPVFVALRDTISQFSIPRQPFEDLISAFEQDQRVHEYETFTQLRDYCRRSADPVGRIVLYLCGCFTDAYAHLSDSICTGLQLANFWQDVARDFDIGRVYLPRETRRQFGYSDEDLRERRTNEAFLNVMRFEVARARQHLLDGLPLVEVLPGRLQIDIELFARGGLSILDQIERIGYRVWERRPAIAKREFATLFAKTLGRNVWRRIRPRHLTARSGTNGPAQRSRQESLGRHG
jgi:squalene synthase HpnC